jgi:uncharacterized protein (TIGR02302 family)
VELERLVSRARLALAWERLWPLLWPPLGVVLTFLSLALLDVFPLLPVWLHASLAYAAAILLGWLLIQGSRRFVWPSRDEALRRLEIAGKVAHRPASEAGDSPATGEGDPVSAAFWNRERARRQGLLSRLKPGLPHPGMARRDPWGLRALPLLLLVIGLAVGWREAPLRLAQALAPFTAQAGGATAKLTLWITPPPYTGQAARTLEPAKGRTASPLTVPEGSKLLAVIEGGAGKPEFSLERRRLAFEAVGTGGYRLETVLDRPGRMSVRLSRQTLGVWKLDLAMDKPPSITFDGLPGEGGKGRLRFGFEAADDYGIASVLAIFRRPGGSEGEVLEVPVPLPGAREKSLKSQATLDLAGHDWAGMAVEMTLAARDAAGNVGFSESKGIVLPLRRFTHPVAAAVDGQRRALLQNVSRHEVATALAMIGARPDLYGGDLVTALALAVARSRLVRDRRPEASGEVRELLWQTALRIEEGSLADAERRLNAAEKALREALERKAEPGELERLVQELKQAFNAYMAEMLRKLAEKGSDLIEMPPGSEVLDPLTMRDQLDKLGELSALGARDAAQSLLDQLSRRMEALKQAQLSPPAAGRREAAQLLSDLDKLAASQRALMDKTMRMSREPPNRLRELSREQQELSHAAQALRKRLQSFSGETARDLSKALEQAGQDMDEAAGDLAGAEAGEAQEAQARALARLGEGVRQALERRGQGQDGALGLGLSGRDRDRDPFGREGQGGADDGSVRLPAKSELMKAREILDELRRRAKDPNRPQIERDYLDRLLKMY